ncbi:FAD-dependent oxidoreductase [Streptomyces sp. NPDC003077]|uniref:FAD-dependent oxidoreductase n=1 Tax=Streptomyces sp. NPDC003077 TaxID=3154443 RepID=UPI0033A5ED23
MTSSRAPMGRAPADRFSAVVVGGGWSGIAAAWYLAASGARVTLLDENTSLGGRCANALLGERAVTLGGKNIGRGYTHFREFTRALGFEDYEHFGINSSQVRDGRLHTVDSTARRHSARELLGVLTARDALRLLRLAWAVRRDEADGYLGGPAFRRLAARLDDPPLSGYFGPRTAARLVRPVTVRMNGAEPDEAHLGNFGSNLRMLMDTFDQLSGGFAALYEELARRLDVRLSTRVTALTTDASGRVDGVLAARPGEEPEHRPADAVVVALPAPAAAPLVEPLHDRLAGELRAVRYFPAAVAVVEYERPVFPERVRALVFDAGSPVSNAGAYGTGDRHIVRYTFSGRAARRRLADGATADDLVAAAEHGLAPHFPAVRDNRRVHTVTRRWDAAYCAYGRHHARRLDRVGAAVASLPGLVLTGDYVRGASIEACFRAARERTAALTAPPAGRARPSTPARR